MEQIGHQHIGKVLEWGFDKNYDFKCVLWGCIECDATTKKLWVYEEEAPRDHKSCGPECFRCKAKGLQLNTGDAGRDISDKAWTARLANYREARANGIQPAGTTPEAVQEAWRASETLGRAYDAESMTTTNNITKHTAEAINAIDKIAATDTE